MMSEKVAQIVKIRNINSRLVLLFFILLSHGCGDLGSLKLPTDIESAICKDVIPDQSLDQQAFLGLYPGTTEGEEILEMLGTPQDSSTTFSGVESLQYSDFTVYLKENTIDEIYVSSSLSVHTIREYFELYGCPQRIYLVIEGGGEAAGELTLLLYSSLGIEIVMHGSSFTPSQKPVWVTFFEAQPPEDYIENDITLSDELLARQVSLEQVLIVKDQ